MVSFLRFESQVDYPNRAISIQHSKLIKSQIFAEQISHLNGTHCIQADERDKGEARNYINAEVPCSKDVIEWLFGAVSNRRSYVDRNLPIISKKMRDEPGLGFRRSGLWISLKVFLQLSLTIILGEKHGKHIYKLIMLRFMSTMCSYLSEYQKSNLSIDTANEMLGKIARRIDKLTNFTDTDSLTQSVLDLTSQLRAEAVKSVSEIRHILDMHHKKMQHAEATKCRLSTQKQLHFEEHVIHKLSPEFREYLKQLRNVNGSKYVDSATTTADSCEMVFIPQDKPCLKQFTDLSDPHKMLQILNYVENWVLTHLSGTNTQLPSSNYLRKLAIKYLGKAQHFYDRDPLGYSRMVLTMLKIIKVRNFTNIELNCLNVSLCFMHHFSCCSDRCWMGRYAQNINCICVIDPASTLNCLTVCC